MSAKPAPFGRRGAAPTVAVRARPLLPSTPELSPAAQALLPQIVPPREPAAAGPRFVPRSFVATVLAGLVVGLTQAGIAAQHPAPPDLLAQALGGGIADAALPVALASGVASGVFGALGTLALVRGILNASGRTGPIDYALCGAALAGATAFVTQTLGLGAFDPSLPLDVASGAAAATLYRFFAGTRPRPAG